MLKCHYLKTDSDNYTVKMSSLFLKADILCQLCRYSTLKNAQCLMTMSAKHGCKIAAHHEAEKTSQFHSGAKQQVNKQNVFWH